MCAPENLLFPSEEDEDATDEEFQSDDGSVEPPYYTPEELAAIILDFYKFLSTLHLKEADIKIAPPGGWPNLTPEACAGYKSDYVIGVMRCLPYIDRKNNKADFHYKGYFVDYADWSRSEFAAGDGYASDIEHWSSERQVDASEVFQLVEGRESYGRTLWLIPAAGEVVEERIRVDCDGAVDISTYFTDLKEAYRTLKLIPYREYITLEAWDVEENDMEITEGQIISQEDRWGTDLDKQYIRQIYRQHGWPHAFRQEEAEQAVKDLMQLIVDKRDDFGWEYM